MLSPTLNIFPNLKRYSVSKGGGPNPVHFSSATETVPVGHALHPTYFPYLLFAWPSTCRASGGATIQPRAVKSDLLCPVWRSSLGPEEETSWQAFALCSCCGTRVQVKAASNHLKMLSHKITACTEPSQNNMKLFELHIWSFGSYQVTLILRGDYFKVGVCKSIIFKNKNKSIIFVNGQVLLLCLVHSGV